MHRKCSRHSHQYSTLHFVGPRGWVGGKGERVREQRSVITRLLGVGCEQLRTGTGGVIAGTVLSSCPTLNAPQRSLRA